jgi:predicted anti-sigma-YlaC factor YlaD
MFKRKSECQIVQGLLSPYIDEELNPADKERVESHLEGCLECLGELESLRSTVKLLRRVAMVTPPRSFAVAEAAPRPQPAYARSFRAFRAATAVAALLLVFTFAGNAANLFEAGPFEERIDWQVTPAVGDGSVINGALGEEDLEGGDALAAKEGLIWPVFELELALSGAVVVLGGATAVLWQKKRRGIEKC